jgi:phenylacetate-CoA ligase
MTLSLNKLKIKVMKHTIVLSYAWILELIKRPLFLFDNSLKLLYTPGFNTWRAFNAKTRAYYEFTKAKRNVPAYKAFLAGKHFDKPSFSGMSPNINEIPFTDKENYVKSYSMDDRCKNGHIPDTGVIIDESSGSSGTATNWVRGHKERSKNARIIKFGIKNLLGKQPLFIINAFALGPWATGVNVTMSCVKFAKLKSLGPDKTKIANTLKQFGTSHHYLIMGYPPFLKLLVDQTDIVWKDYDVTFIFGGESMSEGMREYLIEKGIKHVYSSLGASDLELNLAAENDFTIAVRKLLRSHTEFRKRMVQFPGALPMVFQYNPVDFYFESSDTGELIVTIGRSHYIAPKIRYNLHDRGHTIEMKKLKALFLELKIENAPESITDLPLLLHYGRADNAVSFFGANINPVDIQEVIYDLKILSETVNSFCLQTEEDQAVNKKLIVALELKQGQVLEAVNTVAIEKEFFSQLAAINQDFREAKRMINDDSQMIVRFYKYSEGPFENGDIRIKAKYIQ